MKTDKLKKLNACREAIQWASEQKNQKQAWNDCERGDWMLWLLGKLSGQPESFKRKKLVLAVCECARLSLKYVKKGEERPLKAIETAEKWAKGQTTIEEVREAAAVASAAYAAAAVAAASAAYAVAAAYAAADVAASAAYAAAAAAAATYAAAAAADDAAAYAAYAAAAHAAHAAAARLAQSKKLLELLEECES